MTESLQHIGEKLTSEELAEIDVITKEAKRSSKMHPLLKNQQVQQEANQ